MKALWTTLALGLLIGCTPNLEGGTYQGQYGKDSVKLEFVSDHTVKCTWTRDYSTGPISTSSDMDYSIEGKTVILKSTKTTGKLRIEDGNLVGSPVEFGFEDLDSKATVTAKRQN